MVNLIVSRVPITIYFIILSLYLLITIIFTEMMVAYNASAYKSKLFMSSYRIDICFESGSSSSST